MNAFFSPIPSLAALLSEVLSRADEERLHLIERLLQSLDGERRVRVLRNALYQSLPEQQRALWHDLSHWVGAFGPARERYGAAATGADSAARLPTAERDELLIRLQRETRSDPDSVHFALLQFGRLLGRLHHLLDGRAPMGLQALEVGPGAHAGVAVLLAAGNNSVTMLDIQRHLKFQDTAYYHRLFEAGSRMPQQMSHAITFHAAGISLAPALRYIAPVPDAELPFADQTYDVVYSFAVLEHMRDLERFARESYRVLKPGGAIYHTLDLSDHRPDATHGALTHLCMPEAEWDRVSTACGYYQSRRLARDYVAAFTAAGFATVRESVFGRAAITPAVRAKLDTPYRDLPDEAMDPIDVELSGRKP